jgi:rubrerythrin
MPDLAESRTQDSLREALAALAQTSLHHRWAARRAEAAGDAEVAALFGALADHAEGRAFEALDHLSPSQGTEDDLKAAVAFATRTYTERFPPWADLAREEGFDALATWFEEVGRMAKASAARLTQGLEVVD